jgi:hypothetical protein
MLFFAMNFQERGAACYSRFTTENVLSMRGGSVKSQRRVLFESQRNRHFQSIDNKK